MLKNRGIMVEIFIGHINKNDEGDKGLDDLLVDKLAGMEEELAEDWNLPAMKNPEWESMWKCSKSPHGMTRNYGNYGTCTAMKNLPSSTASPAGASGIYLWSLCLEV